MRIITKITSILLIFVFLASTPAIVLGSQGQLLQAEPSKVAMQAIGLAKHYYAQGKFEKAAELRDRITSLNQSSLGIKVPKVI